MAKLASNENPRGPAPAVRERIQGALGELSRYPDANGHALKQRLAIHHDIEPHRITLGNGSNDVLELAAKFTLEPGTEGIMSAHGFIVYTLAITGCGATLVTVPAKAYGCDLEAMLDQVTDATRIVFIANPNNPTGSLVGERELTGFLDRLPAKVWAVLDEAYAEYVDAPDYPDGRPLLERYPNLIVTRTFSKIHALGGLAHRLRLELRRGRRPDEPRPAAVQRQQPRPSRRRGRLGPNRLRGRERRPEPRRAWRR